MLTKAVAVIALAFPFAMVLWFDEPPWIGRTIAVGYFWAAATAGTAVTTFGPESWLISETGKLSGPKLTRQRLVIGGFLRLCALGLAVFSLIRLIYFAEDASGLIVHNQAERFAGRVVGTRSTWLTWWAFETVSFNVNEDRLVDCHLLFHPWPLKVGTTYNVTVLPRSKEIVAIAE